MPLASTVMDLAAAMCGDRNKTLYSYDKMLSPLKLAVLDLGQAITLSDVSALEKEQTSNTVAVGVVEHPNPPNDLDVPIQLWERPDASTSDLDWVPMDEKDWDPSEAQGETLGVWKYAEEEVKFRGATTARKVKMLYRAKIADVVDQNSTINITNSDKFLIAKTASYAARFIGKNVTLGAELNREAQDALDLFLGIRTKEDQNEVLRMLPYSMRRDG